MKKNNYKILDCTLRDGGYYTNWDFSQITVDNYLKSLDTLPIDYLGRKVVSALFADELYRNN